MPVSCSELLQVLPMNATRDPFAVQQDVPEAVAAFSELHEQTTLIGVGKLLSRTKGLRRSQPTVRSPGWE